MSSEGDQIYLLDILSRLKIGKLGYIFVFVFTISTTIFVLILKAVMDFLLLPYNRRSRIKNWLRADTGLIQDYDYEKGERGHFRFRILLKSGMEVIAHSLNRDVIRIYAVQEIDPGALAVIDEHGDIRNDLQEIIEAVLSNMKGTYQYLDEDREPCYIGRMDAIGIEYRIYTDGFSQQEFMNTILDFDRAGRFVERRVEQMAENLRNQS